MSADLAIYADEKALDQRGVGYVIEWTKQGAEALAIALECGASAGDFVEFKGQAETVRVYTVQKQLGKEAEQAAAELVRRAQRAIGLTIRKGQEVGEIAKRGDVGGKGSRGAKGALPGSSRGDDLVLPSSLIADTGERSAIYALADGVTDEQFDAAIEEAKAEGNLSRANVIRKITRKPSAKSARPEVLRGTRHVDTYRVIAATVDTYADNAIPKDLFAELDLGELDEHDLREWISSLSESARALRSLRTTLKKELNQRA